MPTTIRILLILVLSSLLLYSQDKVKYLVTVNFDQLVNSSFAGDVKVLHLFEDKAIGIIDEHHLKKAGKAKIYFEIIDKINPVDEYYLISRRENNRNGFFNTLFEGNGCSIVKNIQFGQNEIPHYKITRINDNNISIPFLLEKAPAQKTLASPPDSLINEVIEDIQPDSIRNYIQSLQDFGTRFLLAPNRKDVALWIKAQFESFGIIEVVLDSFYIFDSWQYNVIATLHSEVNPEKIIVVGGHHDSITGNPMFIAPGADDNASGTAAVLEIARVIMLNNPWLESTIKFVTFAAEEYGLHGSKDMAKKFADEDSQILLMINHDMISNSSKIPSLSSAFVHRYKGSERFVELAKQCIEDFTPLEMNYGDYNPGYSDSYSFWSNGFNVIYFEEGEFSPVYHSNNDVIENCNIEFAAEVIKASCATLISAQVIPGKVEDITISDVNGSNAILVKWQASTEHDLSYYKIYAGPTPGNYNRILTSSQNQIVIDDLTMGLNYYIGVSVVDNDGNESTMTQTNYIPVKFNLNKGILIVDESNDGNGGLMRPTDAQVDDFFHSLLEEFEYTDFDVLQNDNISVADLSDYSTIVWHGNDQTDITTAFSIQDNIARYLNAGGKLFYTGYNPSKAFGNNGTYPNEFTEEQFLYHYLKIAGVEKISNSRFRAAKSAVPLFSDLIVDTTKLTPLMANHLTNIESINPSHEASVVYTYDTGYDISTNEGSMKGNPVGIEYLGVDYKIFILSFPLYYIEQEKAKAMMHMVLTEKFSEPVTSVAITTDIPNKFHLYQNYPNPFNPGTTISYSIPQQTYVSLKVFDLLGREITELVSKEQAPGKYKVNFNAENLSSGVYLVSLTAGEYTHSKKILLLK